MKKGFGHLVARTGTVSSNTKGAEIKLNVAGGSEWLLVDPINVIRHFQIKGAATAWFLLRIFTKIGEFAIG